MNEAPLPDGGHLAYEVRGFGPPILLVRPLGGSVLSWGRFADALAERARVIMFDSRGTGASSAARWRTSTREMAHDARCLLDHVGVERAHVYGISLGGMVASWLAVDAPNRVGELILASTLPRGSMIRGGSWRKELALARCLTKSPAEAEACMSERLLSRQFRAAHPDEVRRIRDAAKERPASRRGLLALLLAAWSHDVEARLHEIKAPTLVLVGEYDPLLTVDSQRRLLQPLAHASYAVVACSGHDVSVEAPRRTAEHVLDRVHRGQT